MTDRQNEYTRWREAEAARLLATGQSDTDTVRELLILSCHSSPRAERFFEERLSSEELLNVLLGLAVEDYSGDAQMTASYWVSRFPSKLLAPRAPTLEAIAASECGSAAFHARNALAGLRDETPNSEQ